MLESVVKDTFVWTWQKGMFLDEALLVLLRDSHKKFFWLFKVTSPSKITPSQLKTMPGCIHIPETIISKLRRKEMALAQPAWLSG